MIVDELKMLVFAFMLPFAVDAQNTKQITLLQAFEQGIANSKNLKLINRFNARLETPKEEILLKGNISLKYNYAEIRLNISTNSGNPIILPQHSSTFIGRAALMRPSHSGGKLKWVKESAKSLIHAPGLNAEKDNEEMAFAIISFYYNPYKVLPSKKIVMQNLQSAAQQIKQAEQFFKQGIVTKNEGPGFQLQQANALPTFELTASFYPSLNGNVIPKTIFNTGYYGANLSWSFRTLWGSKNKIAEGRIQQAEINIQKSILLDQVKSEVNKNNQNFDLALKKIEMLASAVRQAAENNRLLISKYKNNLAPLTDLIDAETILYQAKVDLEDAKADSQLAFYRLKSTEKICELIP